MTPPKSMIFIGGGDFEEIGKEFRQYLIDLADLKPHHRVLEVGCGIGRMAIPLTDYLTKEGSYQGFDITKQDINWCQSKITPRFDNFRFTHCNVLNKHYNKNGTIPAREHKFPYNDNTFDLVFLTSVFTHMFPSDFEHYMSEISRVLKPSSKCLATFFIINDVTSNHISKNTSSFRFRQGNGNYFFTNSKDHEAAIAFEEGYITQVFSENGLNISNPINYGSWSGRPNALTFQDLIIATKT